jgi:hypothetical protein
VRAFEANRFPVRLRVVCPAVPVKVPVTAARLVTFPVATLAVKELRARTFPVTAARLVTFPVARFESPVTTTDVKFETEATLRVVELINGITIVSKLKMVFVAFDVNPAAKTLVVVTAFDAYRLLVTIRSIDALSLTVRA